MLNFFRDKGTYTTQSVIVETDSIFYIQYSNYSISNSGDFCYRRFCENPNTLLPLTPSSLWNHQLL